MAVRKRARRAELADSGQAELGLAVKYTGPFPDSGRMGALEVGPAILGIGEMVSEASRAMFGDATRVRVDVRADFEHASFGIEFFLVSTIGDVITALRSNELANMAVNLGFLVAGGAGAYKGVIGFLKWQKNRKIIKVEEAPKGGGDTYNITVEGGSTVNMPKIQYVLTVNPRVRRALENVVRPLENPLVETVEIKQGDQEAVVINREEAEAIVKAPPPDATVTTTTTTAYLEVVSPVFREKNKWRFAQGESVFHAAIEDEAFLNNVAKHQTVFGAGDVLQVDLEIRTTLSADGRPDYDRIVKHVYRHMRAAGSAQLPMDLPPKEPSV